MNDLHLFDGTVFRVIDTEGTSRIPSQSGICEVAFVDIDAQGHDYGRASWLTNPYCFIPPEASAIHHITNAMVDGLPGADEFVQLLLAEVYVAHNAPYDSGVLSRIDDLFSPNVKPDPAPWIDVERLAKHLYPDLPNHGVQYLRYALDIAVNVPMRGGAHSALNDALVTAATFVRLLAELPNKMPGIDTVATLIAAIKKPVLLKTLPFKSSNGQSFEHAQSSHLDWIVRTGAGGEDCVHTALHWLNQRGDNFYSGGEEE